MKENTNPRAIEFEDWKASYVRSTPTWLARRLAVRYQHMYDNTTPITA